MVLFDDVLCPAVSFEAKKLIPKRAREDDRMSRLFVMNRYDDVLSGM